MKKFNDKRERYWYALTNGPDQAGGRQTRYYVIECRLCGRQESHHANSLTDEKLRKLFIRSGWDIGKTTHQHRCPGCKHKHADRVIEHPTPSPPPPPEPPPISRLESAWAAASAEEKADFLIALVGVDFAPALSLDIARHSRSEPLTTIERAPEPEPEPIEDEAPADWWLDMQSKVAS